jgi:GxxExxY protein
VVQAIAWTRVVEGFEDLAQSRGDAEGAERTIMKENEVSGLVVDCAMHIHRTLGPGLLESVYETVLAHELTKRGCSVRHQVPVGLTWDGLSLDVAFRADLIVDDVVVVELKSVEQLGVHPRSSC